MKVFVSYSSHDDVNVRSLVADLEQARQQVWLGQAPSSVRPFFIDRLRLPG